MREKASIIMAAGKGTRMKSSINKLLHKILGKEIIKFPVEASLNFGVEKVVLVVGPHNERDMKRTFANKKIDFVLQKEALGTAHAVWQAQKRLLNFTGDVFILVGDSPYLDAELLKDLYDFHLSESADITVVTAEFNEPPPYGRIIKDKNGNIERIVEEIDATEEEKKIREVSASYYCFRWEKVEPLLKDIKINQRKKEYYLTDIVEIGYKNGLKTRAFKIDNPILTKGINTREDLSEAALYFSKKNIKKCEEEGVTFIGKETITVEFDVEIGMDTVIYPNTYIGEGTKIGRDCKIGPFVYLKNANISDKYEVSFKKIID